MNIRERVYWIMLTICSSKKTEIGGILGGENKVIKHLYFDVNRKSSISNYSPDTKLLNCVISDWQNHNIEFCGIFHSHLDISEHLSPADGKYIKEIMLSMPDEIECLYFPLVLPKCGKIISYKAIRQNSKVNIIRDDVEIIKKEA